MGTSLIAPTAATAVPSPDDFQRYYEEAGPDYASWSAAFNMHFGFFRRGMNPMDREAMLEQMNQEVLRRMDLDGDRRSHVLDLGCGLGATLRSIARCIPDADLHGITLVPWQLERADRLNRACPEGNSITVALGNYEHTAYPPNSFDAVYAIESSCYASGANKSAFLGESYRLLRPGGRLVVADGFLGRGKLRGPQKAILRKLCQCWVIDALGEIGQFTQEMERVGFQDIVVEGIQARVTPSVLHVPWVTLKFLLSDVLFGGRTRVPENNRRPPWNGFQPKTMKKCPGSDVPPRLGCVGILSPVHPGLLSCVPSGNLHSARLGQG